MNKGTQIKTSGPKGVMKCLEHASKKVYKGVRIDVPLIFDKHKRFSKKDVVEGIKMYEEYNRTRFKQIIVVSLSGRIHRHKHND